MSPNATTSQAEHIALSSSDTANSTTKDQTTEPTKAQIILAPSREPPRSPLAIFLAGTTTAPDWRDAVAASLSHRSVTIFNPLRHDWDSSWREDETFGLFREQVQWELDAQEASRVVVIYFGPDTDAPISLLELGLAAREGKALVVCHPRYGKRGNVQIVCRRYGITVMDSFDGLAEAVMKKLAA
ncbi:hypothetical protein GE09DRAFT_977848 [Coniochaeta sp. 2T2.1]|nr:hypothetical protein GE09DRAFT_977848 [Coniochaeta sp. 2T2.1]